MENGKKTAAIYVRVSTGQQEDGTSLDTQIERCWAEAERQGYRVNPDYVWREVWPGDEVDRPVLNEARLVLASGVVDVLFAYQPDRLARDPIDLLTLVREFKESGVESQFVLGVSDDTPEGQLLMYISGYVGSRERALIAERTLRGKERVARDGQRLPNGTGSGLYGYDYDRERKVRTINEAEAAVVRQIFQWGLEGVSYYQVAVRLNEAGIPTKRGKRWHPLGVKRLQKNRAFTGVQFYGEMRWRKVKGNKQVASKRPVSERIRIEGFTPRIISDALFNGVQERLRVRQAQAKRPGTRYQLTGFVRCGKCGAPVCGASLQRKHRYYRCRATAPTTIVPAMCDALYIRADSLESLVWDKVASTIKDPSVLIAELQHHFATGEGDLGGKMADLRREIADLKGQQRRLIEMRQKEGFDLEIVETQLGPVKALCDEKEASLRLLEEQQRQRDDAAEAGERIAAFCKRLAEGIDDLDLYGKRAMLAAFGVRVEATREEVSITIVVDPNVTTIARTLAS